MSQIATIAPAIPQDALEILLNRQAPRKMSQTLWDAQIPISGHVAETLTAHPELDVLATTQLAGLATDLDPAEFSKVAHA